MKKIKVGDTIVVSPEHQKSFTGVVNAIKDYNVETECGQTIRISDIKQVNGEYWLTSLRGSTFVPELNILIRIWEEGKYGDDDKKALFESLDFMCHVANKYRHELVVNLNEQIAKSIKELSYWKEWGNLNKIAQHAQAEEVNVIQREIKDGDDFLKSIEEHSQLQLEFLNTSISEYAKFSAKLKAIVDRNTELENVKIKDKLETYRVQRLKLNEYDERHPPEHLTIDRIIELGYHQGDTYVFFGTVVLPEKDEKFRERIVVADRDSLFMCPKRFEIKSP